MNYTMLRISTYVQFQPADSQFGDETYSVYANFSYSSDNWKYKLAGFDKPQDMINPTVNLFNKS